MSPTNEADGLMKALGDLGTLIGLGSSLKDLFGGGNSFPTAEQIAALVVAQVTKVFFQQQADAQIITASGNLAAAQQFLAVDYQNAKDSGETKAELWTKLDASSATPSIGYLTASAETLDGLISSAQQQNQDLVASKAATVYVGLYLIICLFHRERAAVAPDDATKAAEQKDMRDKARIGLGNIKPYVVKLITDRLAGLSYGEGEQTRTYNRRQTVYYRTAWMTDTWFSNGGTPTLTTWLRDQGPHTQGTDYLTAARRLWAAYNRVIWMGEAADCAELKAALGSPWLREQFADPDSRDNFVNQQYDSVCAYGAWSANIRNLLMQLDVLASGVFGDQQDSWAWCATCGSLYYDGGTATRCANGQPHGSAGRSYNYTLHVTCPSTPSGMQAGWLWCRKCSGSYFGSGASVCAAGGSHDPSGSGNYLMACTPVPDDSARGIDTTQTDWYHCDRCGLLHCGDGVSACPAGGAHSGKGSTQYWLTILGNVPPHP